MYTAGMKLRVPYEFALTYVNERSTARLEENVRRLLGEWRLELVATDEEPGDCDQWLSILQLDSGWSTIATDYPFRDALARSLARGSKRSAVWFDKTTRVEIPYGTQSPPQRHGYDVEVRSLLEVESAKTFLVEGRAKIVQTPAYAALRAKGRCERGHLRELDLTAPLPVDEYENDDPPQEALQKLIVPPLCVQDLQASELSVEDGWYRLASKPRAKQRVLWVARCPRCGSRLYASLEWQRCFRRVRALARRPALQHFDVIYDPNGLEPDLRADAAKKQAARERRPERDVGRSESVRTFVRRASAARFRTTLLEAQRHGRKSEAAALIDELFLLLDERLRDNPNDSELTLLSALDFEGPLSPERALQVGMVCVREGFDSSAEELFALAAPISRGAQAVLRQQAARPEWPRQQLRLLETLLDRHGTPS